MKSKSANTNSSEGLANYIERVKIPLMWRNNVKFWLSAIESQLIISEIIAEKTKYHYMIFAIASGILVLIENLTKSKPIYQPYNPNPNNILKELQKILQACIII